MTQRKHTRLPIALALFALLLGAGSALALTEEGSVTHPLAAGGRISLESINGDVTVETWSGDEVRVDYVKKGSNQAALDRIEVEIEASSDHIHIETDYRKSEDSGWFNSAGSVDFTLQVPRGARLDSFELINGSLTVTGLSGTIKAELVNGGFEGRGLSGSLEIEAVNGSVTVELATLGDGQSIEIESVNGPMEVRLPAGADAAVEASTVHGPIDNDLGFTVEKGRYVGRSMEGVLGNGSARVELESVNGSIDVRSAN